MESPTRSELAAVDGRRWQELPPEIGNILLNGHGSEFLEALATASFSPRLVDHQLDLFHNVAADTATRWTLYARNGSISDEIICISCFARILPFADYLRPMVSGFLATSRVLQAARTQSSVATEVSNDYLRELFLSLFRLLSHDLQAFSKHVRPIFICSLLSHERPEIRYLAVECLSMVMHFADALNQSLIDRHVATGTIVAQWEDQDIDYRLFKLYEERRWQNLQLRLALPESRSSVRNTLARFNQADIAPGVVSIGGALLPNNGGPKPQQSSFVKFSTSNENLSSIGQRLQSLSPILLVGPSGAGKTALVREAAHQMGMLSSMITLHLNDQTDAKSLLGIYTSSSSGAGFEWQPGVLTKAVQEGRWVLIEDIDRAPVEVMGLLRPLIENNELFLPSQKARLRPQDGFRIFGTVRSSSASAATAGGRNAFLSNERLWSVAEIKPYSAEEVKQLLLERYSNLVPLVPMILTTHKCIQEIYSTNPSFKPLQSRLPSIRDLMKWCRRLSLRLLSSSSDANPDLIPETFMIDMLKDGIDCYGAHLGDSSALEAIVRVMAENLNITPSAADHAYRNWNPVVQENKNTIHIGRSLLPRLHSKSSKAARSAKFALTRKVRQQLEAIASATASQEPMLLVGETGIGKTTILQYLAALAGQNLTVVNLSNQSEASDLLGGLKPVTTRSLVVPLLDEFNELFEETFSINKNSKFQESVTKAFVKQRWQRLLDHWEEAVQLSLKSLPVAAVPRKEGESGTKRRKLDSSKYLALREHWNQFGNKINQLKAQIRRTESNQVFSFVESRLVQAVRNGSWLLLDEINLASPEALDNLVSLLQSGDDGTPYLLLADAGNIERINAHPDFRIYAAMNPATDTGKKDLPPAIRAHFTELFVHAGDTELNNLVEIIQAYLGSAFDSDKKAATDLAKAYLALKQLSTQHRLTDGAGDLPHFSLRSLTRCLQFVQQHGPSHGLRRAMYDGMQMSFFTVLDQRSQRVALPAIEQHLITSNLTKRILQSQKPNTTIDNERFVAFEQYAIMKGSLPSNQQPHYIITSSVRRNLTNLARAASMGRFPVLLQGPTSAGKTSMVEYLAKYTGNKFVRVNNHEHTDLQEYLGSYASGSDGKLEYREGVLVEALRKGYWIVLDELNLAPSDVLEALNRLLDDNRELLIPESQEVVHPHANFMLFATQNPAGLYGGRKRLSRAFRNRFLEIHVDEIPDDELEFILTKRTQIAPTFCKEIVKVYKNLSLQRQSTRLFEARNSFATLRDLFRWASRPVDDRTQLAHHGYMLLAERVRDLSEKAVVKSAIEEVTGVQINDDALYSMRNLPTTLPHQNHITWTRAMRRLFILVSTALKNDEPVLLVGATGCGKTQVCQCISEAFGKCLDIYNAHSNTETGDLIGSQRPVRHKSELARTVMQDLHDLGEPYTAICDDSSIDIDGLISQFKNMDTSSFDDKALVKVRKSIAAYQSLFTWSDGSLVRAMKSGNHFLLDEISLAEDSVLERLNSLLEPARTILLAEKGAEDNIVVAEPGFQFLSTMNPGGDYGKRELSAALRNRMTEIWVPPLSESEDVTPILQTRLRALDTSVATKMIEFAKFFQSEIQSINPVSIPLRTLISWVHFVIRNTNTMPFERALLHGAAMAFVDSLGANPAGISTSAHDLQQSRDMCLDKLSDLFALDSKKIYYTLPVLDLDCNRLRVGDFAIARTGTAFNNQELILETPTTLRNMMRIARALQTGRPLLLEGNPGVGKTAIISSIAKLCGKSLTRVNLSDQTDLMDLFGADAPAQGQKIGNFVWRDGPLLQAMQAGHWVLLDEMNLATQSVLEGLNACLDHRQEIYIAELDKTFKCHPDFMLFATQNPVHQGGGRKGLPASFVNRFTVVYADAFNKDDLLHICKHKYPSVSAEHINKAVNGIELCQRLANERPEFADGSTWELNLRDLHKWLSLCDRGDMLTPSDHFATIIASRFRGRKAKLTVCEAMAHYLGTDHHESLYNNLTSQYLQVGTIFLPRNQTRQDISVVERLPTVNLFAAKAVLTALKQNWPVILTGPSGSGKTSLIRSLAALSGARLVEFAMNADVDTADIVGGYEQFDVQRVFGSVRTELSDLLAGYMSDLLATSSDSSGALLRPVLQAYEQICHLPLAIDDITDTLKPVLRQNNSNVRSIDALLTRAQSLQISNSIDLNKFVWNDGVLTDALLSGSWLVLDNANFCNPSVLDRLNSLLEPNGYLLVNEQHDVDGEARLIRPHPNFRIILTVDPRYGELSRAMRNRSLEIFVELQQEQGVHHQPRLPEYPADSRIFRLRELFVKDARGQSTKGIEDLEPFVERLSCNDMALVMAQYHEHSLDRTRNEAELRLGSSLLRHQRQLDTLQTWTATGDWGQDSDVVPFLPSINEPLVHVSCAHENLEMVKQSTNFYFINLIIAKSLKYLESIGRGQGKTDPKSWLARTAPKAEQSRREAAASVPAFSFLQTFGSAVATVAVSCQNTTPDKSLYRLLSVAAQLLADMILFFDHDKIEESRLQAYTKLFRTLIHDVEQLLPGLSYNFRKALTRLRSDQELQSGHGLQNMWPTWRGSTASTRLQLDSRIAMERLMHQFDELCKSLPHPRAELAHVRIRLLQAFRAVLLREDAQHQISILENAINELGMQRTFHQSLQGHFAKIFDILVRKARLHGTSFENPFQHMLTLFGHTDEAAPRLRTGQDSSPMSVLYRLYDYDAVHAHITSKQIIPPSEIRPMDLKSSLQSVCDQTISQMNYAVEELETLIKAFARNYKDFTSSNLPTITQCTILLLRKLMDSQVFVQSKNVSNDISGDMFSEKHFLQGALADAESQSHLQGYTTLTKHAQDLQSALHLLEKHTQGGIGRALLIITIVCLKLLVPDKLFDPAVYPQLVRERHERQVMKLTSSIKAWKSFQETISGESSSFVIEVLEENLANVGESTPVEVIYRPVPTQLDALQAEYSNLVRSVIDSDSVGKIVDGSYLEVESHAPQLLNRIKISIDRLGGRYRAYDDMLEPVNALLYSAALAIRLIICDAKEGIEQENSRKATDKFGQRHLSMHLFDVDIVTTNRPLEPLSVSSTWAYLRQLKLRYSATSQGSHEANKLLTQMVAGIDQLYLLWKGKLTSDQKEAEARSRYYSYRGEDELGEPSDADVEQLFPSHNVDDIADTQDTIGLVKEPNKESNADKTHTAGFDVQQNAIELAQFHRDLLRKTDLDDQLQLYLRNPIDVQDGTHTCSGTCDVSITESIPTLFLDMERMLCSLTMKTTNETFNIYTDSDISETRKLFDIITQTQSRFVHIANQWPDHAVPPEVLGFCTQAMQLRMNDPLIKLLTKAEKLLEIVARWQAVASREWSAGSIVDGLTNLIIHWRRLELGSWSKLLDLEDAKQQKDADAWYFIAYETVIYNSLMIVRETPADKLEDDGRQYSLSLAKALEDFVRNTTLGQYASRLQLLRAFAITLRGVAHEEITAQSSSFGFQEVRHIMRIHDTLTNVINHYTRYEQHIENLLKVGRAGLEKSITQQIKLTSWKDTNITALRESARRSHFKLFKIVKKYRALLAQPITGFATAPLSSNSSSLMQKDVGKVTIHHTNEHVEYCAQNILNWQKRPERLTNPVMAANTMRHVYNRATEGVQAASELADYLKDLTINVHELRKATPPMLTKDNAHVVRDLKQRKRRLLAETMKDLSQMGIQRNLGTSALGDQASTATILAGTPALVPGPSTSDIQVANEAFHELLDTILSAREAVVEHSHELTDGEVRRGLGYAEGFLRLAIKQRTRLAFLQQNSRRLQHIEERFSVLDQSFPGRLMQASQTAMSLTRSLERQLAWLPSVLKVYSGILEVQAKHGQLALDSIVATLNGYISDISALHNRYSSFMSMPLGIQSENKASFESEASTLISKLRESLERWTSEQPEIEHVIQQLHRWTYGVHSSDRTTNGFHDRDIDEVDSATQEALNKIFVVMQSMSDIFNGLPASSEDQNWLTRTTDTYSKAVSALHLDPLLDGLDSLLDSLHAVRDEQFHLSLSAVAVAVPIFRQFCLIVQNLQDRYLHLHVQTCRLALYLGKTFTNLSKEGFCTPSQNPDSQEQSGKVEQGTGLGEGEAADDISKDVGDDEDLTDLAQEKVGESDSNSIEKSKDAVEMGADELEGEFDSGDEQESGDEINSAGDDGEDQDIEEEVGSVDNLDPNAVDEKMWNDMQKEAEKQETEMKSQKAQGQRSDDQTAREEGQPSKESEVTEAEAEADVEEPEVGEQKFKGENVDPHMQEESALEMPEDIQLNGEDETHDISDAEMDDLSDISGDQADDTRNAELSDEDQILQDEMPEREFTDERNENEDEDVNGKAQDDEIVDHQSPIAEDEAQERGYETRPEEAVGDVQGEENGSTDIANNLADSNVQDEEMTTQGESAAEAVAPESKQQRGAKSTKKEENGADKGADQKGVGRQEEAQAQRDHALKKLADMLDEYHLRRDIFTANEDRAQVTANQDVDMTDVDFEHVENEDQGETQALGTAEKDVAQNLNREQAVEHARADMQNDLPLPEDGEKEEISIGEEAEGLAQKMTRLQGEQVNDQYPAPRSAILPDAAVERPKQEVDLPENFMVTNVDESNNTAEEELPQDKQIVTAKNKSISQSEAQHLWLLTSTKTQALSLMLTEELRLILQPTTATKLRGDFRTGKRLNIRRIIPYIASGYKRDKIWMRRSVPSKRNYQVMLAVDDSKSMAESGADILALETLCMLSRSLSMLEVGDLSIVAFGKDYNKTNSGHSPQAVKVAHPFSIPFSPSISGPETVANFAFNQTGTDVKALLYESIKLFKDARIKSSVREAADLWQLQIIISDGHIGSDSDDSIRRLVRKAREEKIMSVFVIVDNSEESIVDLKQVVFEKDPKDESGELKPRTKRYLEGFPFQYYVVVREVRDLPGVLARVLKGWFESVVESG